MSTKINIDIFNENNMEFMQDYFELLVNRLTYSNLALEPDLGDPIDSKNAIRLRNNMNAFKYLIKLLYSNTKLMEQNIINVGNTVNEGALYISKGYRKVGDYIADTNIPITRPENISKEILILLSNYNTTWKDLDVFEKEAKFHLKFVHIHPFEDGNGRTSRLLLNYNLLKQGHAPVIITTDLLSYYYHCIEKNDVESLAKLFWMQSIKENKIIDKLYEIHTKENKKGYKNL